MAHTTVVPAYGRDYTSQKEVQEAWDSDKDFIVQDFFSGNDGRAVNRPDAAAAGIKVSIRYAKLTKSYIPKGQDKVVLS